MRKFVLFAALFCALTSCNNSAIKSTQTQDSVHVDTTVIDSSMIDTISIN